MHDEGNAETVDDEDDGYGDDDFDAYSDEEFEPYETISKPVAHSLSGVKRVSNANDAVNDAVDVHEVQAAMRAENDAALNRVRQKAIDHAADAKDDNSGPKKQSKQSKSESKKTTASKPVTRKYLHLGADLSVKSLKADDPRVVRARMLKQQLKFNQEKFVCLDQSPLSEYDLYIRKLHNLKGSIAQKSSQSNEDDREIETQTDDIEVKEQEVQFQCGNDDTNFYNLISTIEASKAMSSVEERKERLEDLEDRTSVSASLKSTSTTTGSLSRFLRKTSKVMEDLLVELRGQESAQIELPMGKVPSVFQQHLQWTDLSNSLPVHVKHYSNCVFNVQHTPATSLSLAFCLSSNIRCSACTFHRATPC